MKLSNKQLIAVSVMLFSLFFGAGNLIFPPFLGQMAGAHTPVAMLGFLITAVVLPVMGVIVVAKFNGMDKLASKVNVKFAFVFTILIYLSIGPGLGIPRAASVPFEMAISPLLPEGSSFRLFMLIYSLIFFAVACWLALAPSKLVDRFGKILSPCLLVLIGVVFVSFLFNGDASVAAPQGAYKDTAFVTGFLEGYNTMDAIAALNFGLVIAVTLRTLNVKEHKSMMHYTVISGVIAGSILSLIYVVLSFMGMKVSALYSLEGNGAWTLRCIVKQLFGAPGAVLLAVIFTMACLTTCVGLITSISQYFSSLNNKLDYRQWVFVIVAFSFVICNQGLNTILSISVPVLNAIYPVAIMLIVLGLCDRWLQGKRYVYPLVVGAVTVESVLYSLDSLGVPLGFVSDLCSKLPFYGTGMGWVVVALVMLLLSFALNMVKPAKKVAA